MTSPELTGGAGFTYEDAVAAHYLAAMVAGTTAVALDGDAFVVGGSFRSFGNLPTPDS